MKVSTFLTRAVGSSLIALGTLAYGQTSTVVANQQPGMATGVAPIVDDQKGSGAAQNSADEGGIQEVVVTAQRRTEVVQKSSLSISVLDSKSLAGTSRSEDLQTLVPGLTIGSSFNALQTNIRGVGDKGSSLLSQSAVSYNIDGVYASDAGTITSQYYDLDRVEILKGPQGTLYGRNASAGSINLVYAHPKLNEFAATVNADVGNFGLHREDAAVNLPLSDTMAARVAGVDVSREGYLSDGTSDDHHRGIRAQLLFEPSDRLSIRIASDYGSRDGRGPANQVVLPHLPGNGAFTGSNNPIDNAFKLANTGGVFYTSGSGLPPADFTFTGNFHDEFIHQHQSNVSAEVNADLGLANLTLIPAYRTSDQRVGSYPGNPVLGHEHTNEQSYELRLQRSGGWGNVVVGVNRLVLNQLSDLAIYQAIFLQVFQNANVDTKSIAGFGQGTFNLSDSFRVILGARYTSEDRNIDADAFYRFPGVGDYSPVNFTSPATFNSFTYRAGLEYDVAPNNMVYFTASKGFKSGGFNIFQPTPQFSNVYEPETLYSYVFGTRNRFLDNRLQLNLEAFYWDYKNAQLTTLTFTPAGDLQQLTFNAAGATSYGAEGTLVAKPSANDTLSVGIAFLHTKLDKFILNTASAPAPGATGCAVSPAGDIFQLNCSGFPLAQAPKWSGVARYDHALYVNSGTSLTLGGGMSFASSRYIDIDYVPVEHRNAYALFDADTTLGIHESRYKITAYVKNIADKEVAISSNNGQIPGYIYANVLPPRTFGLRFSADF